MALSDTFDRFQILCLNDIYQLGPLHMDYIQEHLYKQVRQMHDEQAARITDLQFVDFQQIKDQF